ncbi:hypothetical protein Y032_0002g746 [Ancylostoma ceylanicum]|uniref:Uncharacterized protein n=1 Tax=Ancylostoma ceylanicum TaxID=53326 RepID=A0A016W132_9BILA|nr:hypothetical protein Y032_0002g746 [Ancylostoma ceylanicum]
MTYICGPSVYGSNLVNQQPYPIDVLMAVCQVVLGIEMSTESNYSRRAGSNDVLEIRKNGQKPLLLRQNVILTWTSFSDRKQGESDENLRLFIGMSSSAAAIIDKTSISVLENNDVYPAYYEVANNRTACHAAWPPANGVPAADHDKH